MNTVKWRQNAALLFHFLPHTGAGTYWKFVEAFGALEPVLFRGDAEPLLSRLEVESASLLRQYLEHGDNSELGQRILRGLEIADRGGYQFLCTGEPDYPDLLAQIHRPPSILWWRGASETLSLPQIAIVGSRSPSAGGRDNARRFAAALAGAGFAITSGLALGVDAEAHRGALEAKGPTIAVLGSALDQVYPRRNIGLAEQIVDAGGTLLSEFPPGTAALAKNFPQRNRIISGLSLGTLVVEAATRSGSLITARCALRQNREVFAIPGSIHNPMARGCHQLIQSGAKLVESTADIVEELGPLLGLKHELLVGAENEARLDEGEAILMQALGYDPVNLEQLVERTGFSVADVLSKITAMELKGLVEDSGDGYLRV